MSSVESLVREIAQDIKDTQLVCEGFNRTRSAAKIFRGEEWSMKLTSCIDNFTRRRNELNLYMTMHTAHSVEKIKQVQEKMYVCLQRTHGAFANG